MQNVIIKIPLNSIYHFINNHNFPMRYWELIIWKRERNFPLYVCGIRIHGVVGVCRHNWGVAVQCAKCKQRKLSLQRPITTPCLKKNTRKLFPLFTVSNMPNNVNFSRYSNKNDTGRNFYQKIFVNIWQAAGTRYYVRTRTVVCRRIEFILYCTTLKHYSTVFTIQSLELRAMVNMCVY